MMFPFFKLTVKFVVSVDNASHITRPYRVWYIYIYVCVCVNILSRRVLF